MTSQAMPAMGDTGVERLRAVLAELRQRNSQQFEAGLEQRKLAEREWANFSRDKHCSAESGGTEEQRRGNAKWYSTVQESVEYRNRWLRTYVPGKVFLDYACGDGWETLKAAKMGAALAIGLDISNISVANGAEMAEREGLADRCAFLEGDCEATGLPDESVDAVLCSYMLHHLNLDHAYPELYRILKPGGRILACEALNYNPVIKLYRQLTPEMRTEWEKAHILSLRDVRRARKYFEVGEVRFWHLFSVLSAFVRRVDPLFKIALPSLNAVDRALLKIPGLRLMAWQFSFELIKPGKPTSD